MALSDDDVVRYSRQILLPEVGGKGQERLLAVGAAMTGKGSAQATAAAYLAAGGTPLALGNRTVIDAERGFLIEAIDVGRSLSASVRAAVFDVNPNLLGIDQEEQGRVGELPASFGGPTPWVALGWSGRRGAVVYRSDKGCGACFVENASVLESGPASAGSVLLGALGALAFQRLALGLSKPLGGFWLEEDGTLSPYVLKPCAACMSKN